MSTQDHLKVLRERWRSVVAMIVLAILGGIAVLLLRPPQYTANIQMYVSSPTLATSEETFLSAAQLAQDRVVSYGALATSPRVLAAAVAAAGPLGTPDGLADRVTATTEDDSVVIAISVEDSSAPAAAAMADAVGQALSATVDELERPPGPARSIPPVALRAVEPAPIPQEESSESPERLLGIAFLVGLAVGVALAFARHSADNTLRSPEQLADTAQVPNLGQITQEPALARRPLVVTDDSTSVAAEDFRRLRTNLQFIEAGKSHKVLMIFSALAGEGKSTTTVNLAVALALAGNKVLLIDADLRRPKAAELLGAASQVGLTTVLAGRVGFEAAITATATPHLDVLASGLVPPNPSELLASAENERLLEDARERYDVVLIDTSPLVPVTDAAALAPFTDAAILVCRANRTSTVQVKRAMDGLRAVNTKIGGSVLVMADRAGGRGQMSSYSSRYGGGYRSVSEERADASSSPSASSGPESSSVEPSSGDTAPPRLVPTNGRPRPRPRPRHDLANDQPHVALDPATEQLSRHWNGQA